MGERLARLGMIVAALLTAGAAEAGRSRPAAPRPLRQPASRSQLVRPAPAAPRLATRTELRPTRARRPAPLFGSFFLGGFESSTGKNKHGQPIDEIAATQHDRLVKQDYRRLRKVGIKGVRETMRWSLIDKGNGKYDFSSVDAFVKAGRKYGVTQIWDLFHYGYPEGSDPFAPDFADRFASYCKAAARYLKPQLAAGQVPYFTLVNEISFFAFAGGDNAEFAPFARGRGGELKRSLVKAQIAGTNAIREILPDARFVHSEPLIHPHAPSPELARSARDLKEASLEVFDMIRGAKNPELGGSPRHLDIVGLNYYPGNQFYHPPRDGYGGGSIPVGSPTYIPPRDLLADVHKRYGREIMITETAQHRDAGRAQWMSFMAKEAKGAIRKGVPLVGMCLYPIIGMKEWHGPGWLRMGLWDLYKNGDRLKRVADKKAMSELQKAIRQLDPQNASAASRQISKR